MGRPKAMIPFAGVPLVERVFDAVRAQTVACALLGSGEVPARLQQCARIPDAPDAQGPLAGILAALRSRPDAAWLIAACDMPTVTPAAIAWLTAERRSERIAVLPSVEGQIEPLLAIYEPAARMALEDAARSGCLSPRALASHPQASIVTPPAELRPCWDNVNTPTELRSRSDAHE